MKILALDLGKFNSVACFFDTESQAISYWTLSTDAHYVATMVRQFQPELVVFESCALSAWVHDVCVAQGCRTLVCNPNQEAWRWKNVKRKTDRDDALKLAKLAALGQLVPVHIPPAAAREHRWLTLFRKRLVSRIPRAQNAIRSLFQQHGLALPPRKRCWTIAQLDCLSQQGQPLAECGPEELWRGQLSQLLAEHQALQNQLRETDRKLTELAAENSNIQLLTSIPGVGRVTAEIIVTQLDRPERFTSARQVSSYAGFVPRHYQSGQMDRRGGINRYGSRWLRSALVECAWIMLRYNPWAQRQFIRLCHGQKNRRKKAVVAIARRLIVRCWAMLRDQRPWQDDSAAASAA